LFKILKVPVKRDSQHYMAELEVSDESGTDDSGINEDRITNNVGVKKGRQNCAMVDGSVEKLKETEDNSEEKHDKQAHLSFLKQLDARIKSSKQESEKLR